MPSPLRLASGSEPSPAVRSGWASVKSGQTSWRGWKRMWLHLTNELHIYDWESSESVEINLSTVSQLERVQHDEAPCCCFMVAGSLEYYISYWSEGELYDWINDIYDLTPLKFASDMTPSRMDGMDIPTSSSTNSLGPQDAVPPLKADRGDGSHSSSIFQSEGTISTDDDAEWRDDILNEYADAPKSPMSTTFGNSPLRLVRKRAFRKKSSGHYSQDRNMTCNSLSWTVSKQKLYQNLLSLLVLVTSVETLRHDDSLVDVLRELFRSIEALDSISTLLTEPVWLRDMPWEMRKKDETELVTLLRTISASKSGFKAVLSLRGARAQQFLDMAHEILHFPSLQRSEDKRFGMQVLKLMIRLSEICHKLPSSLFLEGVSSTDKDATFWGSFSNVYRASYLGQTVALKRMRFFESDSETAQFKLRRKFCREALVWQHLKHPNVLPFIGIDSDNFESLCMVSPWMENGTVPRYLKVNNHRNVDIMLYGIAQGLAYLHSLEVIHGDLRGTNILVDKEGNPRIADFGLAVLADMSTQTNSSTYPGSVRWMAPELLYPASQGLDRFQRTRASDVYSFACVCVELYTGLQPFSDIHYDATVALKVVAGERPDRPVRNNSPREGRMPSALWTLVQSCWCQVCSERPSINTVVKYFKRDIIKGRSVTI